MRRENECLCGIHASKENVDVHDEQKIGVDDEQSFEALHSDIQNNDGAALAASATCSCAHDNELHSRKSVQICRLHSSVLSRVAIVTSSSAIADRSRCRVG